MRPPDVKQKSTFLSFLSLVMIVRLIHSFRFSLPSVDSYQLSKAEVEAQRQVEEHQFASRKNKYESERATGLSLILERVAFESIESHLHR